jgi:RNA polymerase sigma-70 factor (ECF subfamily)
MPVLESITSDDTLFTAIVQGDVDAFDVFYARYAPLAFSLAMRILQDDELAEEATQDAFVSLWRGRVSYDSRRGSPTSWLFGIVRHRATDAWRRESRHPPQVHDSEARLAALRAPDDVETQIEAREGRRQMVVRLAALPRDQRDVIVRGFCQGLTHSEIAHDLQLPAGTAKGRIRLGLARLRVAMVADSA